VTVTDNASATATASVVITQPTALALTPPTITNVLCNGSNTGSITAHAEGGITPYFFNWSNGGSTATISNLTAGPYTVTVTDDNGCTKSATYQVTQPAAIVIMLVNLTNESCAGANNGSITISVSGGVNPIFAEWSNGFLGTTISNLPPDIYSVTVTDNNNCTKTASFTINPGSVINVNLNQLINVSCPGGSNGSISVTATGGTAPYTYLWSNGTSGPVNSGLSAGSYIVTATDSQGCKLVKGYTITQPQVIVITINQPTQNLCFGNSTADLTSLTTGGTSPYISVWSNGVSGPNNSNLPAGTYTITITDNNGCTSSKSATITDPPLLTVNVSTTDETGVGANNGTATASPAGGTGAFTYLWNTGATVSMITGLPPGTYSVTVSDANACSTSGSAQVDPFGCLLALMLPQDFNICEGDTGLIVPLITGESGSITYVWSNGSTGATLSVSQTGEYCLTITDGAGCQDMDCIVVTVIIIPALNCTVTNESSPGAQDGAITCSVMPGIVSYAWNTGDTTMSISGLSPGVYCVTVSDANGCTKSQCFNVQPGNCQLTVTSSQLNVACAGDSTGSIAVIANNSTPPVQYLWTNGDTTSTISNLAAGMYGVTVSDGSGCFATDNYIITQPDPLSISVDTVINVSQNGGAIEVTISGGIIPYQFVWTLPDGSLLAGQEDLNGLQMTGNYQLMVTDANGCTILSATIFVGTDVAVEPTAKYKSLKVYPV
ncbi:MAG: SprB repeat-containing protein, partial [Saprospiraceae bacterium]